MSNWTEPLTGARYGTKVDGRLIKWPQKILIALNAREFGDFPFSFWGGSIQTAIAFKKCVFEKLLNLMNLIYFILKQK
jgi:hypothetical protein